MTAEVVTLHGVPITPPEPDAPESDVARYLRGVADLIDSGQLKASAAVVTLCFPGQVVVQHVGFSALEAIAVCGISQRALGG